MMSSSILLIFKDGDFNFDQGNRCFFGVSASSLDAMRWNEYEARLATAESIDTQVNGSKEFHFDSRLNLHALARVSV